MANRYWVGGAGTWDGTAGTKWSTTSGGVGGSSVPGTADIAIFDTNSNIGGLGASYTVTRTVTTGLLGMQLANPSAGVLTLAGTTAFTITTSGLTVSTGVLWTNTGTLNFTNTCTVSTNGVSIASPITINATAAQTVTLGSALTTTGRFTLTLGKLTLGANNFTCNDLVWADGASWTVNVSGGGQFYVTGNSATVVSLQTLGFYGTLTGTPVINLTYSGSTGTRTVSMTMAPISINVTAGSDIFTFLSTATNNWVQKLNFTGFSGTWTNTKLSINSDLTISSGMTVGAGTNLVTLSNNTTFSTGITVTSNNKTLDFPVTIDISGLSVTLADAFALGSTRTLTLTNGTLTTNGFNLTTGLFASPTGTKALDITNSIVTLSGTGTVWNPTVTGLTFTSTGSTIAFSDTSVAGKTFAGGGLTYNNLQIGGATGVAIYTFTGANTWTGTWSSVKTVASTITLPSATTTTVGGWTIAGTSGNLIVLNSSASGNRAVMNFTGSGVISVDYLNIRDSSVTPLTTWYAGTNSTNLSNNLGWVFTAPPAPTQNSGFFFLFG